MAVLRNVAMFRWETLRNQNCKTVSTEGWYLGWRFIFLFLKYVFPLSWSCVIPGRTIDVGCSECGWFCFLHFHCTRCHWAVAEVPFPPLTLAFQYNIMKSIFQYATRANSILFWNALPRWKFSNCFHQLHFLVTSLVFGFMERKMVTDEVWGITAINKANKPNYLRASEWQDGTSHIHAVQSLLHNLYV